MNDIQNGLLMKKIVAIASNKNLFSDFIIEFNNFFAAPPAGIQNILKELETFRTILSNKFFIFSANAVAQFEKELELLESKNDLDTFFNKLQNNNLLNVFNSEPDEVLN